MTKKVPPNKLGSYIRERREVLGKSLGILAAETGLAKGFIGDIESGRRGHKLPPHTISVLAQALHCTDEVLTAKMVRNDFHDRRKYGEYYRVLRSSVRAAHIARLLERIRQTCRDAKSPLASENQRAKLLQAIETTANEIDKTLAYRGRPPASVRPGTSGDDDKFLEVGKVGKG